MQEEEVFGHVKGLSGSKIRENEEQYDRDKCRNAMKLECIPHAIAQGCGTMDLVSAEPRPRSNAFYHCLPEHSKGPQTIDASALLIEGGIQ